MDADQFSSPPRRLATTLLLSATLASCGPGTSPPSDADVDGIAQTPQTQCVVDPALIQARRACALDLSCPCGTHCELGVCVAECGAGLFECFHGETCDNFGRCQGSAAQNAALVVAAPTAVVTLGTEQLKFVSNQAVQSLEFRVTGQQSTPVRFTATAPYEVQCEAMGPFARECEQRAPGLDDLGTVRVRMAPGTAPLPTDDGELRVYSGRVSRGVSLAVSLPLTDALGLQGTYTGTATLTGDTPMTVPVTASVWAPVAGGSGTIALREGSTLLLGAAERTARLQVGAADGSGRIVLPSFIYAGDGRYDSLGSLVIADASGGMTPPPYSFTRAPEGNRLSFNLAQTLTASAAGTAPVLSWNVSLRRQGDLPVGAPEPTVANGVEQRSFPASSPWENALRTTYRQANAYSPDEADRILWTLSNTRNHPERRVEACRLGLLDTDSTRAAFIAKALYENAPFREAPNGLTSLDDFSSDRLTISRSLLEPFFNAVTAVWRNNANLVVNDFNSSYSLRSQFSDLSIVLPVSWRASSASYSSAFCRTVIREPDVRFDRVAYIRDLGWEAALDNRNSPGALTASVRLNIGFGPFGARESCAPQQVQSITMDSTAGFNPRIPYTGRPANCAELIQCAHGTNDADGRVLDSQLLNPALTPLVSTGDLACGGSGGLAFEIDIRRSRGAVVPRTELLTTCLEDLDRLAQAPAMPRAESADVGAAPLFATSGCLNAGRWIAALGESINDALAPPPPNGLDRTARTRYEARPKNARFAHRLLQQWLELHTAIATEAYNYQIVPQSIRGLMRDVRVPPGIDIVNRLVSALALFQNPRVRLFELDGAVSAAVTLPDYRVDQIADFAATAGDVQTQHYVVQREQLLQALLALIEPIIDRALRNSDNATLDVLGRALRTVQLTTAVDRVMAERLRALAPQISVVERTWFNTFVREADNTVAKLLAITTRLAQTRARGNVLGIADGEVPLYFSADLRGAGARFTPVTDYLLGVGNNSTAWAPSTVVDAQRAAERVTASFQQNAQRDYQQLLSVHDLEERRRTVREDFGGQVAAFCGTPQGAADADVLERWQQYAGNRFSASSCYFRTEVASCRQRFAAQLAAQDAAQNPRNAALSRDDVLRQLCISGRDYFTLERSSRQTFACNSPRADAARFGAGGQLFTVDSTPVAVRPRPYTFADDVLDKIARIPISESTQVLSDAAARAHTGIGCTGVRPCSTDPTALCMVCRGHVYPVRQGSFNINIVSFSVNTLGFPNPAEVFGFCGLSADGRPPQGSVEALTLIARDTVSEIEAPISFRSVFFQGQTRVAGTDNILAENEAACNMRFPEARRVPPPQVPSSDDALDDGSCYRGSLGDMVLNIRNLTLAARQAKSQFDTLQDQYNIEVENCITQNMAASEITAIRDSHRSSMRSLRAAKREADNVVAAMNALGNCASRVQEVAGPLDALNPVKVGAAVVGCMSDVAGGVAQGISNGIEEDMGNAEANFADQTQRVQNNANFRTCMNGARQYLTGQRSATVAILQAQQQLLQGVFQFNQALTQAQSAFDEGRDRLASIADRALQPPGLDSPLDADIARFYRQMRLARRVTYLAVRAAEYELQQSLAASQAVLAADTPAELQLIIDQLRVAAATRRVQGSLPSETLAVISLRDQLLRLRDSAANAPLGEQRLSPAERFRNLVQEERYAVRDSNGAYVGQRIPFTISPPRRGLGAGPPDNSGISLLSGADCAERLWSVNLALDGPASLVRGSAEQSFVRVEVQRENDFYSQWCSSAGQGTPFQTASFRPAINLFQEPDQSAAGAPAQGGAGGAGATNTISRARVRAYVNVARNAFENSMYEEGSSSELAGRGLYGTYYLFIPASSISRAENGTQTSGINLALLNDVLFRLNYVSVARPNL